MRSSMLTPQCQVESTGDELVTFTFSQQGVNGVSLDKCGCHDGSHVLCSYDDTGADLACPATHPPACAHGGRQTEGDNVGASDGGDGGASYYDEAETEGLQSDDNTTTDYVAANLGDATGAGGESNPTNSGSGRGAQSGSADQSGPGWGGADLLDPASTARYTAPSLDDLLAMPDSMVAKLVGPQEEIVTAIRKVSAESGVPSGLLAAVIIEESEADRTTMTNNNGYTEQPVELQKDIGIIQSPLWRFEGATVEDKTKSGQDPYQNLSVFAEEAAQKYAETGSWGQVAQIWYVGHPAERLGGVTGGESSETNYVLNVFGHLALGGSTYYPAEGY